MKRSGMLVLPLRASMSKSRVLVPLKLPNIRELHFGVDTVPLRGSGASEVNFRDKMKLSS